MKKQVSTFACVDSFKKEPCSKSIPFDEKKLEKMVGRLAVEAENLNVKDSRQAADLMKKYL